MKFVALIWLAFGSLASLLALSDDTHVQMVKPPANSDTAEFGFDVALVRGQLYVGAPGDDAGAVYVYDTNGKLRNTLHASDGAEGDRFGAAVDGEGAFTVVGAPASAGETGAAYVYSNSALGVQEQRLTLVPEPLTGMTDRFGWALEMAADTLLVGAPGPYITKNPGEEQGSAYIFERNGNEWLQTERLTTPTNTGPGTLSREFGRAVAVTPDGTRVAVGEPGLRLFDPLRGQVHLYLKGPSGWELEQTLAGQPTEAADIPRFGHALALSGQMLAIGAPAAPYGLGSFIPPQHGQVQIYQLQASPQGPMWVQTQTLESPVTEDFDSFGDSVALAGHRLYVGAPTTDITLEDAGQVYVYELHAGLWEHVLSLRHNDPQVLSLAGGALDANANSVLAGIEPEQEFSEHANAGVIYFEAPNASVFEWDHVEPGLSYGPFPVAELEVDGLFTAGSRLFLDVQFAHEIDGQQMLVVGSELLNRSYLGGVLIPFPHAVLSGPSHSGDSASHEYLLPPRLPSGDELWFQLWAQPSGMHAPPWVATRALHGVAP
ncbi:MAG: hypothetical protein DHS20C15_25000 [Planctomycetota bacterium]|nr:MAG: hypothetical protein DHS20C15_25000 [Planctomycetota bacterium]